VITSRLAAHVPNQAGLCSTCETPAKVNRSERTLHDREQYWKELEPVLGTTHIDGLAFENMLRYFDARTSKISARKESVAIGMDGESAFAKNTERSR